MPSSSTITLSAFDWVTLVGAIASLILAVIAIWLAIHFFVNSKRSENEVSNLLSKLEAQTQILAKVTGKMLDKYVTYSTQPKQADETTILLMQLISGVGLNNGIIGEGPTVRNAPAMQELTTLYIATLYHAALTNIVMQPNLPEDIGELELEDSVWQKTLVERSYADFMGAANWLTNNGGDYIATSTAKHYYDEIMGLNNDDVKDTASVYSARAQA